MKGNFEEDAPMVKFGKIREQHEDTNLLGEERKVNDIYGYQRKLDFSHFS